MAKLPPRLLWPAGFVLLLIAVALTTPFLGLPNPIRQDIANRLAGPLPGSPLGRDEFGRDVLSRLLWGARTSLFVAFASATLAALAGTLIGVASAWLRGLPEFLGVRLADIILCFPPILLALLAVTIMGPGVATLVVMLSILYTPGFVRVAHAETSSARSQDYVAAVAALGAGPLRIASRTLLPTSRAAAGAILAHRRRGDRGRERPLVPRPRRHPADAIMGTDDPRGRATMEQAPLLMLWPASR